MCITATGTKESCRTCAAGSVVPLWMIVAVTCCMACFSAMLDGWPASSLHWPLPYSHSYILHFTVWDFTSSFFSRWSDREKAKERGLWEKKAVPVCYPPPAHRYPAKVRASPSRWNTPWHLFLLLLHLRKNPCWKQSSPMARPCRQPACGPGCVSFLERLLGFSKRWGTTPAAARYRGDKLGNAWKCLKTRWK